MRLPLLQRSVDELQDQNEQLVNRVSALQRQVDQQAEQLKVLLKFVQTSQRDQIEGRAERAVINVLNRLMGSDETSDAKVDDSDR